METLLEKTIKFIDQYRDSSTIMEPPPAKNPHDQLQWVLYQSRLPWLEITGFDPPYAAMLKEAQNLRDRFVDHRGENGTGWLSLCVHGISAEHTNCAGHYGLDENQVNYTWTDIKDSCPATVDFFKNHFYYNQYQRVRFMLLKSGGYIEPHVDNETYFLGGAVNISLNNPKNCSLTTRVGTVPYKDAGSIFFFNTSYEHAAHNASEQDRYHIIVHGAADMDSWQNIILNSFWEKFNEQC